MIEIDSTVDDELPQLPMEFRPGWKAVLDFLKPRLAQRIFLLVFGAMAIAILNAVFLMLFTGLRNV